MSYWEWVYTNVGGAAICVVRSSSWTASRSGITGRSVRGTHHNEYTFLYLHARTLRPLYIMFVAPSNIQKAWKNLTTRSLWQVAWKWALFRGIAVAMTTRYLPSSSSPSSGPSVTLNLSLRTRNTSHIPDISMYDLTLLQLCPSSSCPSRPPNLLYATSGARRYSLPTVYGSECLLVYYTRLHGERIVPYGQPLTVWSSDISTWRGVGLINAHYRCYYNDGCQATTC